MTNDWNPGFPVYIYRDGMDLPQEGTYFLVAGNGLWMHKDTGICRCFVSVDNISCLDDLDVESNVEVSLPKIPSKLVWQIKQFFKQVVAKHYSEAEVNLFYSSQRNEYLIDVPEQEVGHASVHYQRKTKTHIEGQEDFLLVGTIHSHCNFHAFHSGTDVDDEDDFDGLHVTFGNNDKDEFTISASVVTNGVRRQINPSDILEGIREIAVSANEVHYRLAQVDEAIAEEWFQVIDEWMKNVKRLSRQNVVVWADNVKDNNLKEFFGNGPFKVVDEIGTNNVIVQTDFCELLLPKIFFKEVQKG